MTWSAKIYLLILVFSAGILLGSAAFARGETVGVVLMHGKWGAPERLVADMASGMKKEGFLVATPEMPWSGSRMYDKGVAGAMAEIDAAVLELRGKGATRIFIAGHSLGASAALRYAGRTPVDGLILLAPGHYPEAPGMRYKMEAVVEKARALVQANKGGTVLTFDDPNSGGRRKPVATTARIFLDYFDPDGPMNTQTNAASLLANVPVLWVVGSKEDQGVRQNGAATRDKLPRNPRDRFIEVKSDHLNTPNNAIGPAIGWIRDTAR